MKSLFYFGLVIVGVIFLYNVFPLEDEISISDSTEVVEERDPMTGSTPVTAVGENENEDIDETENEDINETEDNSTEREELERLQKEKDLEDQLQNKEKENELADKEEKRKELKEKERLVKEKNEKLAEDKKLAKDKNKNSSSRDKISKIIRYAKSKLGKPYKQAGTTDKGYDCSGLIMTSNAKYNVKLPRASYAMAKKGSQVSKSDTRVGDLLFFATKSETPKKVTHVGMVTDVKGAKIYFIHSSSKAGVILNTLDEGYYRKRLIKIKRHIK